MLEPIVGKAGTHLRQGACALQAYSMHKHANKFKPKGNSESLVHLTWICGTCEHIKGNQG